MFCQENGIHHIKTTPKWAQANGEVERQNASLMKRVQIAQAEGQDWKRELRKYVTVYRSIQHSTTGKSPAELLFQRKIRGKLPDIATPHSDLEARDRDAEQKGKAKIYADIYAFSRHFYPKRLTIAFRLYIFFSICVPWESNPQPFAQLTQCSTTEPHRNRLNAKTSDIEVGDRVLVRQDKTDKFTTTFHSTPHKGNSVIVQSPTGAKYTRNTTFVKKFHSMETPTVIHDMKCAQVPSSDGEQKGIAEECKINCETIQREEQTPKSCRPQRQIKLPERLGDYVIEWLLRFNCWKKKRTLKFNVF